MSEAHALIRRRGLFALIFLLCCAIGSWTCAANRDGLWQVVTGHCLQNDTDQSVCPKRAEHYVVVKTNQTPPHFLIVPRARVTGIEDRAFWATGPENYFRDAWLERPFAAGLLAGGVPLERVGIAINSAHRRTQDQLHVHINCVNAQVATELEQKQDQIGEDWHELRLASTRETYRARRMPDNEIPVDLFSQLLASDTQIAKDPGLETAFAASVDFTDGSKKAVVLLGEFRAGDAAFPGHAENLLSNCG